MKLIWHIIKKDIRRDRGALLLWAALFVAQVAIGFVLLNYHGGQRDFIQKLQLASAALVGLQFLMGYVLVARLVHADALLGTTLFWATRPISRRRLLAAKVGAVLLVFGVAPVALLVPWWLWCGFTAHDLAWTAVETFGWQLLMIAPAFLIASLTDDLGRVLLWSVMLFVVGMMWTALLGSVLRPGRLGNIEGAGSAGIVYTRVWLSGILLVLFSAVIAAHHYLTRRLARSIGLTMAGVGVVAAIVLFSERDWSSGLSSLTETKASPEVTAALAALKVEPGAALPDNRTKPRAGQEPSVTTEIYFEGLPENVAVSSIRSRQTWRWNDGLSVSRWSYIGNSTLPSEQLLRASYALKEPEKDPETVAWAKAQQEKRIAEREARGLPAPRPWRLAPPSRPGVRTLVFSQAPEALVKRGLADPPAYEAMLRCGALQAVILAELPVGSDAHAARDSTQVRVRWAPMDRADKEVSILVTAPLQRRSGLWGVGSVVSDFRQFQRGEVWLVNRTTGDVRRNGGFSLRSTRSAVVAGVILSWNEPNIEPESVIRNGRTIVRDPQWMEHSKVVLVAEELVARFTVEVKSDRLEFRRSRWADESEDATASND
jgi:hypothetical protein